MRLGFQRVLRGLRRNGPNQTEVRAAMAYLPISPLRSQRELMPPNRGSGSLNTVVIGLVVVAVLYFAREVLVPVVLAALLSFALAPVVRLLRKVKVSRVAAVMITVIVTFLVILGIGTIMTRQVTQLAEDLPRYQATIGQKIQSLRDMTGNGGVMEKISKSLTDLRGEISTPPKSQPPPDSSGALAPGAAAPVPVEIQQPPLKPLQIVQSVLTPVLAPLATTGIVVIFAVFILLYRQDLRDRFIRLAGARDLHRTTEAMDDAAHRLSRYFLTQTAINAGFGVIIGVALWAIGIPNPVLWGVFGALMRFVPYIGPVIAAAFPAALAIAVSPGWAMLAWTLALFVVVEGVMGQMIEPWLYGHRTGLSPVAVIVAATFWTWLWGPIGLLLSTPLTVCLVVLGRHVEPLGFLQVLLGDEPPLTPEETFYQRMLAGDPHEAADQAELILRTRPLSAFYDDIAMRGLALAQADLDRGLLDADKLEQIRDTAHEVIDDLADHANTFATEPPPAGAAEAPGHDEPEGADVVLPVLTNEQLAPSWRGPAPVLCIGGRSPLDEAAATMLAQLLTMHGIGARCEARELLAAANIFRLDPAGVTMVCLSYIKGDRPVELRYLVRRLRRRFPGVLILTGLWGQPEDATTELHAAAGGDLSATTLRQAVELCIAAALDLGDAAPVVGAPSAGNQSVAARA